MAKAAALERKKSIKKSAQIRARQRVWEVNWGQSLLGALATVVNYVYLRNPFADRYSN